MAQILIIDDSLEVQQLLRAALKRKTAHELMVASDGPEGLIIAAQNHFDLILLDVMMPSMDGYTVARELRKNPGTKTTPIIMFTARAQTTDQEAALEAGANAVISKMANIEEVLAKINEILEVVQPSSGTPATPHPVGQALCILGCRGGVGATTLAVNIAAAYARRGRRVCLVDLPAVSGHVALMLHLATKPSWSDLPSNLNGDTVPTVLQKHAMGVYLLAAPLQPPEKELTSEVFNQVLQHLLTSFQAVIINCSPSIDAPSRAAVNLAKRVVLVTAPEIIAVQAATGMLAYFNSLPADRLRIVLNHPGPNLNVPLTNIEKTLGRPLDGTLPFDPAQVEALTQGVPLAFSAKGGPLPPYLTGLAGLLQKL